MTGRGAKTQREEGVGLPGVISSASSPRPGHSCPSLDSGYEEPSLRGAKSVDIQVLDASRL